MRTLSLGKNSAIAATIGLSIMAAGVVQPASAADFRASGKFADAVNGGIENANPELVRLQGGSFDGTYSVDGLPLTAASPDPVTPSSWSFNLKDKFGEIVKSFSSSSSALYTGAGSSPYSAEKISLFFGEAAGYLLFDFASDFTGIGPIQVNLPNKYGESSKTVAEAQYDDDGNVIFKATELDIVSGSSESVPTPVLLPGLIGMGVSAFKRRVAMQSAGGKA
jgi:hypothetical protein